MHNLTASLYFVEYVPRQGRFSFVLSHILILHTSDIGFYVPIGSC